MDRCHSVKIPATRVALGLGKNPEISMPTIGIEVVSIVPTVDHKIKHERRFWSANIFALKTKGFDYF